MLRKILYITLITISSSWATTLDEIVNKVIENNQDLKSLSKAVEVSNQQIELSNNWKNPVLTFGVNDIQFDDVTKRDLEPMQAQYVGFSQIIPTGNKLDLQENIAKSDKKISAFALDNRKLELKSKVYEYVYNILIFEKKYELLIKYQNNIQKLEELSNAFYENGKMKQSDILKIKILHSKIELRKVNLKNLINNLYLKLEELTFISIDKIEASLKPRSVSFDGDMEDHPKILMTKEFSTKFNTLSKYEKANKNSDWKVNVAYFNRDSKYEDYANISVNIPLSFYDTEDTKSIKAKLKSQEAMSKLDNLKQKFKISTKTLLNNIDKATKKYAILKETMIPLQEDVQTNLESYNSFSQVSPQESIKNLNEVISYEMMLLDELKDYFTSYSKLTYFTQGKI